MFALAEMAGRADITQFEDELPARDLMRWIAYWKEQSRTGSVRSVEGIENLARGIKRGGT